SWMNGDAGLYRESLPADWKRRRVDIGRFGILQVWAVGRLDLLVMKFYAHRSRDLEHLAMLNATKGELESVLSCLERMESAVDAAGRGKIAMAREMVRNWPQR